MAGSRRLPPLKRRVVFYAWEDVGNLPAFDRLMCSAAVGGLTPGNWTYSQDDVVTAARVDRAGSADEPTCMRFFRLRTGDGVPHKIDARRELGALPLQPGDSVTDWAHVVIWDDNYMAIEATRDAPGTARLRAYLKERSNQSVDFVSLFDRSLVTTLNTLDEVKSVTVKVVMSKAQQLDQNRRRGLIGGLLGLGASTHAAEISTKVSVGRSRTEYLDSEVHEEIKRLAGDASEYLDQLVIVGVKDGEVIPLDLLKRRVQASLALPRADPLVSYPDHERAYDQIIAARATLGVTLTTAARIL